MSLESCWPVWHSLHDDLTHWTPISQGYRPRSPLQTDQHVSRDIWIEPRISGVSGTLENIARVYFVDRNRQFVDLPRTTEKTSFVVTPTPLRAKGTHELDISDSSVVIRGDEHWKLLAGVRDCNFLGGSRRPIAILAPHLTGVQALLLVLLTNVVEETLGLDS